MAIFVVIAQPGADLSRLSQTVASAFPNDFLPVESSVWLVAFAGTAFDVSAKLGINQPSAHSAQQSLPEMAHRDPALVFEVGSYFGLASPSIWTWIKTKWEATARGTGIVQAS